MIKIYAPFGTPYLNSSAGKCFLLLEELGLEYEIVTLKMQNKDHKQESYLELNPNGKIPCLEEEDGFRVWESLAINFYLAEKYKPSLLGSSLKEKALIHQWSLWSLMEYQIPIVQIMRHTKFFPEDKRKPEVVSASIENIKAMNSIINSELENKEFIVGNSYTLADLNLSIVMAANLIFKIDISGLPNLMKWLGNMTDRPTFKKLMS